VPAAPSSPGLKAWASGAERTVIAIGELERKRCKVDVEDLILLAVEFGPDGARERLEDISRRIDDLLSGFDQILTTPRLNGFQDCLGKLDGLIATIQALTGETFHGLTTMRSIISFLEDGRMNLSSILSIISSFLPSGMASILSEAGRIFSAVMGLVNFLKNFNPRTIVQGFLGGIFRGAFGKILGGAAAQAVATFTSGTPAESILGSAFASIGGGLGAVAKAVFGTPASTISVQPRSTLGGGFEDDDGVQLSEKHLRGNTNE